MQLRHVLRQPSSIGPDVPCENVYLVYWTTVFGLEVGPHHHRCSYRRNETPRHVDCTACSPQRCCSQVSSSALPSLRPELLCSHVLSSTWIIMHKLPFLSSPGLFPITALVMLQLRNSISPRYMQELLCLHRLATYSDTSSHSSRSRSGKGPRDNRCATDKNLIPNDPWDSFI